MKKDNAFQDEVVEWTLLRFLLLDQYAEYVPRLNRILFTDERMTIFDAIKEAYTAYQKISFDGVKHFLKHEIPNELFVNGVLGDITATIDEAIRYARKRQAAELSATLQDLAYKFSPEPIELQSTLNVEPISLVRSSTLIDGAKILLSDLTKKTEGIYKFAKTGLSFLDRRLGGEWRPKSIGVIFAAPGTGKTAIVGNSMLRMATAVDPTVSLLLSLEMPKEELINRWLADMLEIDSSRIQRGQLTDDEVKLVEDTLVVLQQLPMYVIDDSRITLSEIIYEIKRHVHKFGVRVVFIDYIQILNYHPTGSANNDLGDLANNLKLLAKELGITIVLLSQLTPGKDGTYQIRDSGEVGNIVDFVIKLTKTDTDDAGIIYIEAEWVKNKHGQLARVPLLLHGPFQRFIEGHE